MYNKTVVRFGFCDIQNNQGLGKGSAEADKLILAAGRVIEKIKKESKSKLVNYMQQGSECCFKFKIWYSRFY